MATYSTSLKLTLIGDGEQTGTWGSTTNTNFGTLLEQAIVGQTTIIMANADYTLTNLNGTTDEARSAVIIVTGTQNATYSVIVPAVPKLYMVTNSLTAPQVAYIKMSGGTTTQVPNGQTMYLYCTGVIGASWGVLNYVQNAQNLVTGGTITTGAINCTSLTSSGAVSGTTITASTQFSGPGTGITGSAAGLSVGGTSLNVTGIVAVVNGGSGVTTSTGTGNNVLSTSPTLVTPILGTPQSVALTNATGLPLTTGVTGTLPVANGGTGVTTSTGTGNVVLSASPTLTGSPIAPTQTAGDNSTKIATTAYVATAVTNATGALGTMSTQNANAVAITGGTINGVTGTNAGMTVGNATAAVTATNQSGGTVSATTIGGTTITASSQFNGPGTGLTGTASSLNIGGNAATATSATSATNATTAATVSTTVASGAVGTTQAVGTNNTTIATTAFVQAAFQALHPIGSIYTSTSATNPGTSFGFGTWVAFGAGRVMIGNGGGYTAGATGGSADAIVPSHNHGGNTGTQSADHIHAVSGTTSVENQGHIHTNSQGEYGVLNSTATAGGGGVEEGAGAPNIFYDSMGNPNVQHTHTFSANTSGNNVSHSHNIPTDGVSGTNANLQPYIVVYMWNRTA
jgi:hypothetical protein